jgi:Metallo-beta-lactamase superfamily
VSSQHLSHLPSPLDRSLLHVFVAGPGYGEGVAVALPGSGWILLDGCCVSNNRLPLLAILDRWQGANDPVEALLLTHPHTDHAFGIRAAIEHTLPKHIGVTTSPSNPSLVFASLEASLSAGGGALDQRRRQIVLGAMLAIRQRFLAAPNELLALVDGAQIPLSASFATALIRSPEAALVHARLSSVLRGDPNELSAVLELQFGATRIVLGSDLPTRTPAGATLADGWHAVMGRHPHLGSHCGLKIPHHGSPAAFHEALMPDCESRAGRTWWISPFNQGKRLPPITALSPLVARNGSVSLTATPLARAAQPTHVHPGNVPLAELPALFAPASPFAPGALAVTPPDVEPLEPVWCGAFDDRGALRGAWRGERAFRVVP